mgnify:CR=1 FL=1
MPDERDEREAHVSALHSPEVAREATELSALIVPLLKGVLYRDQDAALWNGLLGLQSRVRDYVAVMGLALSIDEAEGYAFLRSRRASSGSPWPLSTRT